MITNTEEIIDALMRCIDGSELGSRPSSAKRIEALHHGSATSITVELTFASAPTMLVLCKKTGTPNHSGHGHRGGTGYESAVYEEVLSRVGSKTVRHFGSFQEDDGSIWMFLEFLPNYLRVNKSEQPAAMVASSRWIGEFHAQTLAMNYPAWDQFLIRYDRQYFEGWALRSLQYSAPLMSKYPWMKSICHRFVDELTEILINAEQVVLHGEYYPKNIIYGQGKSWPIDWESAALGSGAIDLLTLVEGWPSDIADLCQSAYVKERYQNSGSLLQPEELFAASVYIQLRWLGDRPEWTNHERVSWRFDRLSELAIHPFSVN